jgi:hypothetical protein
VTLAAARFARNVWAVLRERGNDRSENLGLQYYALQQAALNGLGLASARATRSPPNAVSHADPPRQWADGVVEVDFREGRPTFAPPNTEDVGLRERWRAYRRFLALVGYLEPKSARLLLYLHDRPAARDASRFVRWAFNQRRDSAADFVVVPDPHFVVAHGHPGLRRALRRKPPAWQERRPVALWRGSSTGGSLRMGQDTSSNPRVRLCMRGLELDGVLDARITRVVCADPPNQDDLTRFGVLGEHMSPVAQASYRYLVSIDGFAGEWDGLLWKLCSGSAVLRVESEWNQWYTDRLAPFEHYVPVRADLSDLMERVEWCRNHDEECRAIAERARDLMERHVTFKEAVLYTAERLRAID